MKKTTLRSDVIDTLTVQDLCRFCDADETWVIELVEHGVLEPVGTSVRTWRFQGVNISRAKKARRLNRDLGLDTSGVAVVLDLIEQRDAALRRLLHYEG